MRIHEENRAKLQTMSQAEILEEQRKLLSQLGRQSGLLQTLEVNKSVVADCSSFFVLQKIFFINQLNF